MLITQMLQHNIALHIYSIFITITFLYVVYWELLFVFVGYDYTKIYPKYKYDLEFEMKNYVVNNRIFILNQYYLIRSFIMLLVMLNNPYFFMIL